MLKKKTIILILLELNNQNPLFPDKRNIVLKQLPLKGRWRKPVSILDRSLALEEIKGCENPFVDVLPVRHLSISNVSTDPQIQNQIVKVSGNITISF